jgi:sulfide dehydrogenase cytochrome subunit
MGINSQISDVCSLDDVVVVMKKLLPSLTGLSLFFVISLQSIIATADPAVNRLLASQCAQCHGTNGYSSSEFDSIAGEDAKDMYEDLTDMKEEDGPENIMDHQALGYSDEQIRRIAAYYAGLPEDDGNPEYGDSEDQYEQEDAEGVEDEEDEEDEEDDEDEGDD